MATLKIEAAINSIPEKKENLRKSLEALKSYSSSLANFTLQWKDLEDHLSSIENSINDRFKALVANEKEESPLGDDDVGTTTPRGDLSNMDEDEIGPALRAAPDPALLVLEAVSKQSMAKKQRVNLLEKLQEVGPTVGGSVREKALKLAGEWRGKIPEKGDNTLDIMGFLQLIAAYNLVSVFDHEDVLELYSAVSRRKQANNLVKYLGLTENLPGKLSLFMVDDMNYMIH